MFDQLLDQIGTEITRFLDSPAVRLTIQAIVFYAILLWAATAYWAYRDLQSRTTNPVAPYLAAALIILFTPLLFPFGVIVYRIIRPSETVAETNERQLAEEAMMVEIESQPHCANCSRQVGQMIQSSCTCREQLAQCGCDSISTIIASSASWRSFVSATVSDGRMMR